MSVKIRGLTLCLTTLALLFSYTTTLQAADFSQLKGQWQCQEGGERYSLEFQSANTLLYNGAATNYQIFANTLVVQEEYGPVPYVFELQGDTLTFPTYDGPTATCSRGGTAAPSAPSHQPPQGHSASVGQTLIPGRNWPIYARPAGRVTMQSSDPQALLYKFAGRWDHVTSNTLSNLYLMPNGRYSDAYEAGYSGTFEDPGGYQTGAWGTAGAEQSGGHWTIQGTLEQGTITLIGNNGSRTVLNYRVYMEGGEYYGDYYFNGRLYTPKYIYR